MKLEELAALVKQMRDCQRKYFASRESKCLQESKAAEKAVDRVVDEILRGPGLAFKED